MEYIDAILGLRAAAAAAAQAQAQAQAKRPYNTGWLVFLNSSTGTVPIRQ